MIRPHNYHGDVFFTGIYAKGLGLNYNHFAGNFHYLSSFLIKFYNYKLLLLYKLYIL
jgi:hypothetical protein